MKHSHEYRHSTQMSNGSLYQPAAEELPVWCECFIAIYRSSKSAASELLNTLSPEQYHELAYRLAAQANVTQWHMVELLDSMKE